MEAMSGVGEARRIDEVAIRRNHCDIIQKSVVWGRWFYETWGPRPCRNSNHACSKVEKVRPSPTGTSAKPLETSRAFGVRWSWLAGTCKQCVSPRQADHLQPPPLAVMLSPTPLIILVIILVHGIIFHPVTLPRVAGKEKKGACLSSFHGTGVHQQTVRPLASSPKTSSSS